jgi:hypothetical protein
MSYETRKDEMIGKHVAEFQNELSIAKSLERCELRPVMPYGYPVRLYHPHHIVNCPRYTPMCHHQHDRLSNDVPWVLGMEVVDNNVIGVYNPKR